MSNNQLNNSQWRTIVEIGFFSLVTLFVVGTVYAEDVHSPGDSITLGEFIYTDSYAPTTDDCTITIYSPSGVALVDTVTTTAESNGWHHYEYTAPATEGKYPASLTCGTLAGGDLMKLDKTFRVKSPEVTTSTLAAAVWSSPARTLTSFGTLVDDIWSYSSRTLSSFGALAADVWNDAYASVRKITSKTLAGGGGELATEAYLNTATSTIVAEIQTTQGLINALNNISAADVWAYGTRSTNSGTVDLSASSISGIWNKASLALTTPGSVGKLVVDNLDAQVSTRGTSSLTAADVWNSIDRTLSTTGVDGISTGVWSNAARTLTSYGNDITAADVWNVLSSSITTPGSIGLQLKTNADAKSSDILSAVTSNGTLIAALNNITAADVWSYGTRSVNSGSGGTVDLSASSISDIWNKATSALTTSGSIGKKIVDNLDVQVSTRGTSSISAADVWNVATRTLSDYSTSTIASAIWSSASRTLTNYGNDIAAADVWNVLTSSISTIDSIGLQLKTNIDAKSSDILSGIQTNNTLISSLTSISAADVWSYAGRSLDAPVNVTTSSRQAIWDTATSDLSTTGSIGKRIADNLDAQVSSRGTSSITAADVWNTASRTLSDYSTSTITNAVWNSASRTLTNYGNNITAADVWNVLSSSLTTVGSIGKQLSTNVDGSISNVVTEIQTNRSLINALNNVSAADVWAYGTRSITGSVDLSGSSRQAIWDTATADLSASGSIGKRIVDNLDAQVSSRGTSSITAADVWNTATRTLSDYSTSTIANAIWSNAARTLTNYGNNITAEDVWNVLSSSISTSGSIGLQLKTNVDAKASDILSGIQTNNTLIAALNNVSAADVWAYGTRSITGNVDLSVSSRQAIWDTATAGLSASGSIGKRIVDNLDAQVSTRGTSSISAADVWNVATRTLTDYSTSTITNAVWNSASRTLTNYGNDISAADVWNTLSSSLTTVGSIGKQLSTNVDGSISNVVTEIQTNRTLISALSSISAADVWSYSGRSLDAPVNVTTSSRQAIWDTATADLSASGSIGKRIADNLDAQVSTRGISNITAADVWNTATRTLTDYSTSTITTAIWSNASRTLTNYGNDITAADVWNVLSTSLTTIDSIGAQVATNLNATITSVGGSGGSSTGPADTAWSVRMGNVERIQAGYTYRTKIFILNSSSTPAAPVSAPSVTVYDANRNVVVSGVPATLISTGIYEYTYSVASGAAQGLWETLVATQVESGKTIQTNDYWEVAGSPAQVIINSVNPVALNDITGNITITNEGLTGYEYSYEWCVVSSLSNACGGGDDTFHASAAKFINPGDSWNTGLTANVASAGTYYFKLVVYFGTDSSSASRVFTVAGSDSGSGSGSGSGSSGGGGGGGGGGSSSDVTKPTESISACNGADFNRSGFVDSIDFSILLYYWKRPAPFANACVDVNTDSKVDAVDFSIMLYQWGKKPL